MVIQGEAATEVRGLEFDELDWSDEPRVAVPGLKATAGRTASPSTANPEESEVPAPSFGPVRTTGLLVALSLPQITWLLFILYLVDAAL